jgi:hypothetical protein
MILAGASMVAAPEERRPRIAGLRLTLSDPSANTVARQSALSREEQTVHAGNAAFHEVKCSLGRFCAIIRASSQPLDY